MNLPNYFLVDLPPEAAPSPTMIQEAGQALKHNREKYLLGRSTGNLIGFFEELGREWLNPESPFRQMALDRSPHDTGFSKATLAAGLDMFFRRLTAENLLNWLEQDLGHAHRLDEFGASAAERDSQRSSVARGPELMVHFAAGNLPCPAFMSLLTGLLLRSAQFMKCSSQAVLLPRLLAHSIYHLDHKLGACLELAAWKGGQHALERALFEEADCVTATGSEETIQSIRARTPPHVRFLGYGPRVSFGFITRRALAGADAGRWLSRAATDVVAWDQLGCLSPHVFYVESGEGGTAERFAEKLAAELAGRQEIEPRGPVPVEVAAAIATRRAFYEVRAAHVPGTRYWFSPEATRWTVVYETDPRFQLSCLYRFIYVKSVANLPEALQGADTYRHQVSTVGLGAADDELKPLTKTLAHWGAPRICPIGRMQNPPLCWRHDGRPALADLVSWTDWEW